MNQKRNKISQNKNWMKNASSKNISLSEENGGEKEKYLALTTPSGCIPSR